MTVKTTSTLDPPARSQTARAWQKRGLAAWLARAPWRDFFRSQLLGSEATLFDRREVQRLFAGQERGRNNGERLFGLLMFELWRKRYGVSA